MTRIVVRLEEEDVLLFGCGDVLSCFYQSKSGQKKFLLGFFFCFLLAKKQFDGSINVFASQMILGTSKVQSLHKPLSWASAELIVFLHLIN